MREAMRHTRAEVIRRAIREFKLLDRLDSKLTNEEWKRLLPRPETKDPWTVKDALVHITYQRPMWSGPSGNNADPTMSAVYPQTTLIVSCISVGAAVHRRH